MCEENTEIGIVITRFLFLKRYLNKKPEIKPTETAPMVTRGIGVMAVIKHEIKSAVSAVIAPMDGPKRKAARKIGTHSKVTRIAPKLRKLFARKARTVVAAAKRPVKAITFAFPRSLSSLIN